LLIDWGTYSLAKRKPSPSFDLSKRRVKGVLFSNGVVQKRVSQPRFPFEPMKQQTAREKGYRADFDVES
jgi:hypothetical protein